jgi:hypothetical protein
LLKEKSPLHMVSISDWWSSRSTCNNHQYSIRNTSKSIMSMLMNVVRFTIPN